MSDYENKQQNMHILLVIAGYILSGFMAGLIGLFFITLYVPVDLFSIILLSILYIVLWAGSIIGLLFGFHLGFTKIKGSGTYKFSPTARKHGKNMLLIVAGLFVALIIICLAYGNSTLNFLTRWLLQLIQ